MLPLPARRIILGDGPLAYVVALLQPGDPFAGVVGWGDNFRSADLGGYEAYRARFPEIDQIPTFRGSAVGAINAELAISLEPDVVILNLSSHAAAESSGLMSHLARAGIAVIFVDFRTRMFDNTTRSIEILGEVLGRRGRANEFLQFRQTQIERITRPLANVQLKPSVMIERAAGLYDDCCLTYGNGNFGELVAAAGGDNLGTRFLHGNFGTLHPEQVIASGPDVVLVTGANWSLYSPAGDWVNLGPGANLAAARQRLKRLMQRPAYRTLEAVKAGRVYAIWHPFYDNPYYFVALQRVAKWLHPERFAWLDPEQTFRELHTRFLPVPYQPGYWVSLDVAI
ncbi:ABC transporter substrate-binding protein [Achromobacter marplatensis]|uniref:ABC transporter substrate-binding protein n=1 Tax=Achromobacter marplatensis TaxID=470868 RepID=UPI0028EAA99B|nr:ABC transporter substrate-binding protein [Achromobacter marplatensis]